MANTLSAHDEYFLPKMAQLVHGWITGDTAKLKRFREQIKTFHEDCQKCDREWLREVKKTKKQDGESDEDHQKRTGHIPPPPWESPTDLLELPDCHTPLHVLSVSAFMFDSKEPKQSIPSEKILRAYYVLLAILHDKILESDRLVVPISAGIWLEDEPWVVDQWNRMQQEKSGKRSIDLNFKLDRAFMSVKKDIDKLPAKPEEGIVKIHLDWFWSENDKSKILLLDLIKNGEVVYKDTNNSKINTDKYGTSQPSELKRFLGKKEPKVGKDFLDSIKRGKGNNKGKIVLSYQRNKIEKIDSN